MSRIYVDAQTKSSLDVSHIEGLIPKEYGLDAKEVPGARDLLASLEQVPWAVVTSGTRALLTGVWPLSDFSLSVKIEARSQEWLRVRHPLLTVSSGLRIPAYLHCVGFSKEGALTPECASGWRL